ncbi:MAG: 2-isopropylmalate synthase [Ignavibacteria bacterium RIFOXYB2_FULL_35_12]|nr:MAG: 2-isopropylmalate synthase [Ignavibacteria bacterium GWA2_36_19]OGU50336.1 MAG: 2-isopropylmalate synthase [Ignavibacteria bacterium GWC2_35_8]OGU62616.1 MAG: 2-isopropylmalate synthase [Ignavibacteria bacterium GWF2_35_20]OGU79674.1 MAG: 2-isopropylmalate synthase [Ignavibacteria bacterium RIFOXYA2_FULL_35_9]OGU89657.1 MAG: 2-isopropylmalate synthase [Ignavibacteria bacterium RIFOXYA12_FULL_35_25]OGU94647.1 MAG: 2-isopropylmalate synthase [Ignavibacteria bacterium RIFOXYB12_FULL_35_14
MILVLDSTLREGEQTPGVYFDKHIKLAISNLLDEVGVDIIEAGHPMVTHEIHAAVKSIAQKNYKAIVGAHSRSLKSDVDLALECGVGFIGIFYCVSDERLNTVFKKDLDSAIRLITDVIKYAKEQNPKLLIRYTPEDTVRSQFENVVKAAVEAVEAGADIISVADTTGYMVPGTNRSMYDYITRLKDEFAKRNLSPKIAVHCHNDRGLALANALDAYRAGVNIIDAAALGLGERAGIVDLAQLLTVLTVDYNERRWNLSKLVDLYDLVSKHSGIPIPANYPITGHNAFTHCAGVHTHAASINPMHYESLNPELLGRQRTFALDHMSGIASLRYALVMIGEESLDDELQLDVIKEVKSVGQRGRIVDLPELKHIVDAVKHHQTYTK